MLLLLSYYYILLYCDITGITFAVSLLHMLFDFLAFKNDIQVRYYDSY